MPATLIEMTATQRRMLVDTRQLWEAWDAAQKRMLSYAGGMSWKTQKGRDYLQRIVPKPGGIKKFYSLGPRSAETEKLIAEFERNKAETRERLKALSARLEEQARLNKAVDLGRVPIVSAKILRRLRRNGLLGEHIIVAGTNAIFAYEAAAGVFIERELTATEDLDLFMDARKELNLSVADVEPETVMSVIKSVDRSFEKVGARSFRAANRDGFYIDLIKAQATPWWKMERDGFGADDLVAAEIENMKWILNAPKFVAVAIGEDGLPVPMVCPDPRAFALYKLWMGAHDAKRDPVKRPRDLAQARVVARIVNEYLTHLSFAPEHLKFFPRETIAAASEGLDGFFKPQSE